MSGQLIPSPGRRGLPLFLSRRRGVGFLSLVLLACLAVSWFPWTSADASRPSAATPFTLNPTSGPPGTSISASLIFAGGRYVGLTSTITFDSTPVGSAVLAQCPSATDDVGFGAVCTGQTVTITAPQNATPGAHTVTAMVPANPAGGQAVNFTATFTVTAPQTPPSLILNPTSGAAGSLDSVSLIGLLNSASPQTAVLTFDGASLGQQAIAACQGNLQGAGGSGFGALCTGSAVNVQIPAKALPGPHTVTATISSPPGVAALPNTVVSATFTVVQAVPPSLVLNPTSGPGGSTTSVSVINLPANTVQLNAVVTFDTTQIDQQPISTCSAAGSGAGFGALCTGNTVNDVVPAAAQPGPHTVTATITYPSNAQLAPITLSAVYTVTAGAATATTTATSTPIPGATATATVTSTPIPGVTAIPPTNTPIPVAPTATNTATATPAPQPFLILVAPNFAFNTVSVSVRGAPNAKVKLQLTITTAKGSSPVYTLNQAGMTNKAGVYSVLLKIKYMKPTPGKATIHGSLSWGGKTKTTTHSITYP